MYCKYLVAIFLILVGCTQGGEGTYPNPPDPVIECDALVTWEIPVERTDGSELLIEDIAKYSIFINKEPNVEKITLERVVDITDNALTQWKIPELSEGEHWFYMTVTDDENRQSTFSNIIAKTC